MSETNDLKQYFNECVPLLIALGDETRLSVIQLLYENRCLVENETSPGLNVNEITQKIRLSRPAVSHHLKILKDTGLINVRRIGVCNYYYLTGEEAIRKLVKLGQILQGSPLS